MDKTPGRLFIIPVTTIPESDGASPLPGGFEYLLCLGELLLGSVHREYPITFTLDYTQVEQKEPEGRQYAILVSTAPA